MAWAFYGPAGGAGGQRAVGRPADAAAKANRNSLPGNSLPGRTAAPPGKLVTAFDSLADQPPRVRTARLGVDGGVPPLPLSGRQPVPTHDRRAEVRVGAGGGDSGLPRSPGAGRADAAGVAGPAPA